MSVPRSFAVLGLLCGVVTSGAAQGTELLPPILPEAREVALALSAGPPHVAAAAAVYVLRRGGYVRVRDGTNGYTCLVERDHPKSLAPSCYDPEGSATILPAALRIAELRETGATYADARRRVLRLYEDGTFRRPARPALTYMLSPEQVLYSSPDGELVGAWHPHVMIHFPGLTNAAIGAVPGSFDHPFVAEEGSATSHIVVTVPTWSNGMPMASSTKSSH